ncbi:unnamed protein product, partial [Allacma fusca]
LNNLENSGVQFWRGTALKDGNVDLMLPPHSKVELVDRLSNYGIQVDDFVDDVQK